MAIVKAKYTKSRAIAKAAIRYIQHRPGKDGAKITRTLFGHDGVMGRKHAYRMIDEADNGSFFYRIVISPDPAKEHTNNDLHLWEITEQTMLSLEEHVHQPILFVATEHNDHAPHRHVHALVFLPKKLAKSDLDMLRSVATDAAIQQRTERDLARQHAQLQEEVQWEL
jgi:hypothetical protein